MSRMFSEPYPICEIFFLFHPMSLETVGIFGRVVVEYFLPRRRLLRRFRRVCSRRAALRWLCCPLLEGDQARVVTQRLQSAPLKPSVISANSSSFSSTTSLSSFRCRTWQPRISARSAASGGRQSTLRSSRPGRSSAGSIRSGREVAAITKTPPPPPSSRSPPSSWRPSTPSSWVRNWLTTRSVTPVLSCPRLRAKIINQALFIRNDTAKKCNKCSWAAQWQTFKMTVQLARKNVPVHQ